MCVQFTVLVWPTGIGCKQGRLLMWVRTLGCKILLKRKRWQKLPAPAHYGGAGKFFFDHARGFPGARQDQFFLKIIKSFAPKRGHQS